MVALEGASKWVPAELRPLLTENNRLRIAMAFPKRAGAGMVVVGRDCDTVLATWLKEAQNATPGGKSQGPAAGQDPRRQQARPQPQRVRRAL